MRGRAGMLARRQDDAKPGAGIDIDMRIDAALADELQLGQPLEQRRADLGTLADQHQDFSVGEAFGEPVDVLHMIVPDRDIAALELAEARQRTNGVVVVVEDGDFHKLTLTEFRLILPLLRRCRRRAPAKPGNRVNDKWPALHSKAPDPERPIIVRDGETPMTRGATNKAGARISR